MTKSFQPTAKPILASRAGPFFVSPLRVRTVAVQLVVMLVAVHSVCGGGAALKVTIGLDSLRLDDVELREGPKAGASRYISLAAAKKALGRPTDEYVAGLGVAVYAWAQLGMQVQRGFRGKEAGKLFKFQAYFRDEHDARSEKSSGHFDGEVRVDGVAISPTTSFESIRRDLEKSGYSIEPGPQLTSAKKGSVTLWSFGGSGKVDRIEVWCP